MDRNSKIVIILLVILIAGLALGIIIKAPTDVKTFKSLGFEWEIEKNTWEQMKEQAEDEFNHMKEIGSFHSGYSDSLNITVTKDGETYKGIAFAVKNDQGFKCEIRGVLPDGRYLLVDDSNPPVEMKTFNDSGYIWEIKNSTWEDMKQDAEKNYVKLKGLGSITPGYSQSEDVMVTDGVNAYDGMAFAVRNDHGFRCEVRGALPGGERLSHFEY